MSSRPCFHFFGGTYPEAKRLDQMVILSLIFRGTAIPFSSAAARLDVPARRAQEFQFLHILANTCRRLLFDHGHLNAWEGESAREDWLYPSSKFSPERSPVSEPHKSQSWETSALSQLRFCGLKSHPWKPEAGLTFQCQMRVTQ